MRFLAERFFANMRVTSSLLNLGGTNKVLGLHLVASLLILLFVLLCGCLYSTQAAKLDDLRAYLRITEIMFSPSGTTDEEEAAGFSRKQFQYVELKNIATNVISFMSSLFYNTVTQGLRHEPQ